MKIKNKVSFIQYSDPILDQDYKLKIEKPGHGNIKVRINLPEEKNFFRGVSFKENVKLEKLKNGQWIKILKAKFGAGAEELLGLTELHEESHLEARDIRIIAVVEKMLSSESKNLSNKKPKKAHARVRKVAITI